jgi:hypothetical protein
MWRRDIYRDRVICYTLTLLWIAGVLWGLWAGWWDDAHDLYELTVAMSTSFQGLVIYALVAASFYWYTRVSRKIGTFWWF